MTAIFGLQGAHEKGADEFDALLEDVHDAGLSGVVGVIGASLIVKIVKTGRCRLRHILEAVAGIWSNIVREVQKKAMALTRAAAAGSVAKHRIRKREGERWRRVAALLQDS